MDVLFHENDMKTSIFSRFLKIYISDKNGHLQQLQCR